MKKQVKVKRSNRKTPLSNNNNTDSIDSPLDSYTVSFEPGPIGLQLEPSPDNNAVIRVQRFVDGGPNEPGQARKAGCIQLGDIVTHVNGNDVTSYEAALDQLQQTSSKREMTFSRSTLWKPMTTAVDARTPSAPKQQHTQKLESSGRRSLPGSIKKQRVRSEEPPSPPNGQIQQSKTTMSEQPTSAEKAPPSETHPGMETSFLLTEITTSTGAIPFNYLSSDNLSLETASLHSVAPSTTAMDRSPNISPSRIKEIVQNDTTKYTQDSATASKAPRKQPSSTTGMLKTVYKSVAPTAGAVASGSLTLGSMLSTKLGEALVGHSSSEFDTTIQLKQQLLQELSQAKMTLHTQQETIQTLLRNQETERQRLNQELDLSRREKAQAQAAMQELQEQIRTMRPEQDDRNSALQEKLANTQKAKSQLDKHVLHLEERLEQLSKQPQQELITLQRTNEEEKRRWKEEKKQLRAQLEQMTAERETFEQMLQDLRARNERLEQQVDTKEQAGGLDLRAKNEHLQDCFEQLEKQRLEQEASSEHTIQDLRSQNDLLQDRLEELERDRLQLYSTEQVVQDLRTKNIMLQDRLEGLEMDRQQVPSSNQMVQDLRSENERLQDRLDQLEKDRREVQSSKKMIQELQSKNNLLENRLEELEKAKQKKLSVGDEQSHQQLIELRTQQRSKDREIQDLLEENERLMDRVEFSDQQLAKKESKLAESRAVYRELELSKATLEEELQRLRLLQLDSSAHETESSRVKDDAVNGMRSRISLLERKLSEKDALLIESKENATAETEHLRKENIRLLTSVDDLKLSIKRLDESLANKARQLLDLQTTQQAQYSNLQTTSSAQVERLQRELALKQQDLEESHVTINRLHESLAEVSKQQGSLRSSVEDSRIDEHRLRSELDQARTELRQVQEDARQTERSLKKQVEQLERQSQSRESTLAAQHSELVDQTVKLQNSTLQMEQISSTLKATQLELHQAQASIAALEREKKEWLEQEKKIRKETEERLQARVKDASNMAAASLVETHNEISQLKRHVQSLETSLNLKHRENESLQKLNKDLASRISKLRDSLDSKDDELSAKRMELLEYEGKTEDIRDELTRTQDELESCRRSLEKAQDQYLLLSDRLSRITEEFSDEKDDLTAELVQFRENSANLHSRNEELEQLVRSLHHSIFKAEEQHSNARRELLEEREALRELQISSENTRAGLAEKIQSLKNDVANYRELSAVSTDEVHDLKTKNKTLCLETETLKRDCSDLRDLVESSSKSHSNEREALEARLVMEREKTSKASRKLKAAEAEINSIRKEMNQQELHFTQLLAKHEADADTRSKKQSEWLASKEAELKELHSSAEQLRESQTEALRLRESLRRSCSEVEHLESMIDNLRKEHETRQAELVATHKAAAKRLSVEKDEIESALKKIDEQREALESCLYVTEEKLSQARSEHERLLSEKTELVNELHRSQDALAALQTEFDNFRQEQLDASTDSSKGEFSELSRSELKAKCTQLVIQLETADKRVSDAVEDAARRDNHVKRLSEDLTIMSTEIEKLIKANDMLDSCLQDTRSEKSNTDSVVASVKSKAELLSKESERSRRDLEEQRQHNKSLSETNQVLQNEVEEGRQEHQRLQSMLLVESQRLSSLASEAEAARKASDSSITRLRGELSAVNDTKQQLAQRVRDLEITLSEQQTKLSEMESQDSTTKEQYNTDVTRYEQKVKSLESECASLRQKISELEVELETKMIDLRNKEKTEGTKNDALEKYREDLRCSVSKHEDTVSKLSDASRVVASQKVTIRSLEHRAEEAERTVASLTEQMKTLQKTIQKLDTSTTKVGLSSKQLEEIEKKCLALEEERIGLHREASSLKDELRDARQEAAEFQRVNKTLLIRIESMKTAVDTTKAELREAKVSREETFSSFKAMQNEIDDKQMEVDHLKAKVQVLNATIARMKADHLLLQEASLKHEFKSVSDETLHEQLSILKSELHTKQAKIESLSDAYRSQQRFLAMSNSLEEQLIRFIEDIILQTGTAFQGMLDVNAAELVPKALAFLKEKKKQLQSWKDQRASRSPKGISTPKSKGSPLPDSPSIREALEQMKSLLQDEVISPIKTSNTSSGRPDSQYLQNVIHMLEGQIDGLLADLQSANDALRKKDELFADLEKLIYQHEAERESLEKRLQCKDANISEITKQLESERVSKEAAENKLAELQENHCSGTKAIATGESRAVKSDVGIAKQAAGRLIAHVFDRRMEILKAAAFRQWACQTTAVRAVSQQSHAAAALATQLETTREKLVILKRHLKKSRRGREPSLDRILESYETR